MCVLWPGSSWHADVRSDAPLAYYEMAAEDQNTRCHLSPDDCIIDSDTFFVRGCTEFPVRGEEDPFIWGVWVSLSENSFRQDRDCRDAPKRARIGPFFGSILDACLYCRPTLRLTENPVAPFTAQH